MNKKINNARHAYRTFISATRTWSDSEHDVWTCPVAGPKLSPEARAHHKAEWEKLAQVAAAAKKEYTVQYWESYPDNAGYRSFADVKNNGEADLAEWRRLPSPDSLY